MNRLYELYKPYIKLKELKRSGFQKWLIKPEQGESVASHVYGCQILAIIYYLNKKSDYTFPIGKAVRMLAIHELGEIIIGDITPFDMEEKQNKKIMEEKAVKEVLKPLKQDLQNELLNLWKEFENYKTEMAKFCKDVDKAECVLQSKIYTDENAVIPYNDFIENYGKYSPHLHRDEYVNCYDAHFNFWQQRIIHKNFVQPTSIEWEFYKQSTLLKTLPRTGWVIRGYKNCEFVADHITGVCILAEILNSELNLSCDMNKVQFMIAVHELGETVVGDITPFDHVSAKDKHKMEMQAIKSFTKKLNNGNDILNVWLEFENKTTKEAKLCYLADKLEAVYMAKHYVENNCLKTEVLNEFINYFLKHDFNNLYVKDLNEK